MARKDKAADRILHLFEIAESGLRQQWEFINQKGYDFANDEGDVVDYLARTRRQQGLSNDNGISAQDAFYKLWDGLGGLTTKSDGATRKGVFDAVYKKLKKDGYTEAQAQSEAAYQALEIINFGRRGLSPMFRVITSAIPFLTKSTS